MIPILLDVTDTSIYFYTLLFGSQWTYAWLALFIGWMGYDRFVRRKYVLHLCTEEGERLYEIKRFWFPVRMVGATVNWKISRRSKQGQIETLGRSYILDGKDVAYTDIRNKMHIIQPYDEVFGLHPFSDAQGQVKFMKLATAKAENLFQVVAKGGFFQRAEGLRKKLNVDKNTIYQGIIIGAILGVFIGYNILPHYLGAPSGFMPVPSSETITTTTTSSSVTTILPH